MNRTLLAQSAGLMLASFAYFAPAAGTVVLEGFEGLEEIEANVRRGLSLDREVCDAPAYRVNALYRRAPREIRGILEANGYYSSLIDSGIEFDPDCWLARFGIEPGEPVRLRSVSVIVSGEAEQDADFIGVLANVALEPGQQLNHGRYEDLKAQLNLLSRRKGYAEARFADNRIDVYPEQSAADIVLEFDSGPRYGFGEIRVDQDFLAPDLLERYVDIPAGTPFDRTRLSTLYNDLVDSGYFGLVNVQPLAADPDSRQIPVVVSLSPGNRRILSYGGGFSTDTGPRIRISRTNRRLGSRGAQLTINTQLSPVLSEFFVTHRFPYGDPRTEWISFDAGIKREDSDATDSNSIEFGSRRIVKRGDDWQETQFVDLLIEDFVIADTQDRSTLLQPGVSWVRIRADNTIRPNRGDRLQFEVSAASDRAGSDTSLVQAIAESRWIRTVSPRARILARVRGAATFNDDFDSLPPSVRFFAGGDNSIRGYEFRSLGPQHANGDVIGGDRLFEASIEYEYAIKERWSLATFYDVGNAFKSGDFDTVGGFGIGTRWQSPLGPIRIDLAKPLDGVDRNLRLHVSLGPDL